MKSQGIVSHKSSCSTFRLSYAVPKAFANAAAASETNCFPIDNTLREKDLNSIQ